MTRASTISGHALEIDLDWLAESLCPGGPGLLAVDWSPVGTGQVASSYRGRLSWSGEQEPRNIILKCPSVDPVSRETGMKFGLYAKEVSWYRQFRSSSEVNCPACFGVKLDAETGDFLLVLEDCAPARPGDQLSGGTPEQVHAGLAELSHLHAPFFNDVQLERDPVVGRKPEFGQIRIELYRRFWPQFRHRYKDRIDPAILEMGDDFARKFETFETRRPENFTLTHGDFRLDNLLFSSKDDRVIVLDWQTLALNCPMKDVSYFIGTSFADPALRRLHEPALLDTYFAGLRHHGLAFDERTLLREYRLQALTGLVMAVTSSMLVERTERGDEMFAVMAERPGYQALEMNSVSLL